MMYPTEFGRKQSNECVFVNNSDYTGPQLYIIQTLDYTRVLKIISYHTELRTHCNEMVQ